MFTFKNFVSKKQITTKVRDPNINNKNSPRFEFKLFVVFRIVKQSVQSINAANDMRMIFLNKSKLGKWIFSFLRLKESKTQTIKLTITEDKIIPITPKLYGERFPKLLIGAPINNQSKKIFNTIPANDDLKGKFVFSIE